MTPPDLPNSPKSTTPKKGGIQFKPWPLPEALICFAAIGVLFFIGSLLPKGVLPFSALVAGSMSGITMSYLSFCGYSFWTATFKTRLILATVFLSVLTVSGGLVKIILGPNA